MEKTIDHKEAALGWLDKVSKSNGHDASPPTGYSESSMLKAAHIHAVLHVGDQMARVAELIENAVDGTGLLTVGVRSAR